MFRKIVLNKDWIKIGIVDFSYIFECIYCVTKIGTIFRRLMQFR